MTRNEIIETESKILGLDEEQKLKIVPKADYIISNSNSDWYKSTQKKAIESNRGLYAQAIHEANWVLYTQPVVDKINIQNIELKKKIYEVKEAESNLDRNFSEFKIKKYTAIEFFEQYNLLFYDIPPNGEKPTEGFYVTDSNKDIWVSTKNTHKEFIEKSKEYTGIPTDPLDKEIQQLINQISRINEDIINFPVSHPFFKEGDIIEQLTHPFHKYYIQGGKTRPIYSSMVFRSLKSSLGFSPSDPDSSITIPLNVEGIEAIGSSDLGPIYSMQDL